MNMDQEILEEIFERVRGILPDYDEYTIQVLNLATRVASRTPEEIKEAVTLAGLSITEDWLLDLYHHAHGLMMIAHLPPRVTNHPRWQEYLDQAEEELVDYWGLFDDWAGLQEDFDLYVECAGQPRAHD